MAEAPGYDVMSSDSDNDDVIKCDICELSFSGPKPYQQHIQGSKHAKAILALHMKDKAAKLAKTVEEDDEALLLKVDFAKCDVCQKSFTGAQSYYDHLKSKGHLNKVKSACLMKKLKNVDGKLDLSKITEKDIKSTKSSEHEGSKSSNKNDPTQSDEDNFDDSSEFNCDECQKSFSGIQGYVQHMASGVHAKAVKTKEMTQKILQNSETDTGNDYIKMVDEVLCCILCKTAFSGPQSVLSHLKSRGHRNKLENKQLKKKVSLKGKDGDDVVDDKTKSYKNQSSTDDEEEDNNSDGDKVANDDEEDAKVMTLLEKVKKLEITKSLGNANVSENSVDEASVEFEKALDGSEEHELRIPDFSKFRSNAS